jgi:LuxR family transcriptional regulator, maltose regulon positive regulatory protein
LAIDGVADDPFTLSAASGLRGLALWSTGNLDAAHQAYLVCVDGLERAGHISDVLGCSITLADIRVTQGRLSEAARTYQRALRLSSQETGAVTRGAADMHVGLSQVACERGDLDAAAQHLLRSQEFGEHTGLPQNPYRWRVAMAGLREAQGDPDSALDLLDEAQRVYVGDFSPNVRPIPALRSRVLAAQGALGAALRWAREQGLSVDDDLSYLREFEHVTLARVLLSQHTADGHEDGLREVAGLLARLRTAADEGGRTGSLIEILVLQALTQHALGDTAGALAPLAQALTLAEPEDYVRVFVGAGAPMAVLLKAVAKQRVAPQYVRQLLDTIDRSTGPRRDIVDPLSERELDVLRLLATDLDGPDIARRLRVSLNTLRTHTKNIYAKLGVNSRRAAVRQASELNLL